MNSILPLLKDVSYLISESLPELIRQRYDIRWKEDGSPVTAADIYLEKQIFSFLANQIANLTLIGEESWNEGENTSSEWQAVLDPIDGTENFCSGLKEWGTSLSVWHNQKHAGSLLIMPELNEVMMSGEIARIPRSRIVGFSSSYCKEIGDALSTQQEGRIMGCAVYNLFNVIRGSYSRFVNPKGARSWDLLAGVSLAHETGCDITINGKVYNGQFLEPDQRYRVDIQHRYDIHSR